jgi:hypothetical protein
MAEKERESKSENRKQMTSKDHMKEQEEEHE